MSPLELDELVTGLAGAFAAADAERPVYTSRTGRQYQPGIGPLPEARAVRLALDQLSAAVEFDEIKCGDGLPYPGSRQRCDVWVGDPVQWVAEVKMARLVGDNGKPDPGAIKDLVSPFGTDRSALTDAVKLATSQLPGRRALIVYGFDSDERPLDVAIHLLETLLWRVVRTGDRTQAAMGRLVHPHHSLGYVFGWEIHDPQPGWQAYVSVA